MTGIIREHWNNHNPARARRPIPDRYVNMRFNVLRHDLESPVNSDVAILIFSQFIMSLDDPRSVTQINVNELFHDEKCFRIKRQEIAECFRKRTDGHMIRYIPDIQFDGKLISADANLN
jgi:hypothetical protein